MQFTLLPISHQAAIRPEYIDIMEHMNVMWYIHLFDQATRRFFDSFGFGEGYRFESGFGSFALEQHVRYLAEVREGETITIRTRALGRSAKVIHFMHFMLRDRDNALSATGELVGMHADLKARRGTPFPPAIAARYDAILAEHQGLDWEAPVCGAMGVR